MLFDEKKKKKKLLEGSKARDPTREMEEKLPRAKKKSRGLAGNRDSYVRVCVKAKGERGEKL